MTVVNNVSRASSAPAPAPAVDYLLDLLSLAKVPPTEEEELYQAAQRTATKAVIGQCIATIVFPASYWDQVPVLTHNTCTLLQASPDSASPP